MQLHNPYNDLAPIHVSPFNHPYYYIIIHNSSVSVFVVVVVVERGADVDNKSKMCSAHTK